MKSKKIESLLKHIHDYVASNQTLLDEGREADLMQLEENAALLVKEAEAIPESERGAYVAQLKQVMEQLKGLEDALKKRQAELLGQGSGLKEHSKANRAYRAADASDDYGSRGEEDDG